MHRMLRIAAPVLAVTLAATAARADFTDLWADKIDVPQNKAQPRGQSKVLVIPVQIDYNGTSGDFPPVDLTALNTFFTAAASQTAFSFPGYLKVASNGRYTAAVTVAPLVHYTGCPPTLINSSNASACAIDQGDIGMLTSNMDFVRDVFRITHDVNLVNFTQFDINGVYSAADGTIDGVMIVLNIPNVHLTLPIGYVNGGSNLSGGMGGPLILDGIKIPYVSIGGAITFPDSSVHFETLVTEEYAKQLGLTALGYVHPSTGDMYPNWQGLHFSTMGDWDFSARNVIPDPESRRALAWQDQHVVSGTETYTLQPAASGGVAVKLGQMSSTRSEYFLAEARGPVGSYDTDVADSSGNPTWGLAVYHVDWSVGPSGTLGAFVNHLVNCLDCTPWHPFIGNVESGGEGSVTTGLFGLVFDGSADLLAFKNSGVGDEKVLFETGSPNIASVTGAGVLSATNRYLGTNWYDGTSSGISITNVIVNSDHSVTATFTAPTFDNVCADVNCPPLMVCGTTGPTAGSCVAMTIPVADGGSTTPTDGGTVITTPSGNDSGCATSGGETSTAALWLLPLALLVAAGIRRQARSG